MVNNVLCL